MIQDEKPSSSGQDTSNPETKEENANNSNSDQSKSQDIAIDNENNPLSSGIENLSSKLLDDDQKTDEQDINEEQNTPEAPNNPPPSNYEDMGTSIPNDNNENADQVKSTKSAKSSHSLSIYVIQPDPKEVEASLVSLMKYKTMPIEQLRDPVIQLINHKKLDAIIERDYELAEKYESLTELLQQNDADEVFEKNEQRRQMTLDDRSDSITQKITKVQNLYDAKIDKLEQERKDAIQKLQAQHEEENRNFRQKWQDPNFLSKYKHPSQELLNLRFIEKKLAMAKCYDEAKEKKILADRQQKIEEQQTQHIVEEEMKKEFFKFKEAQVQEIKKIYDYYESSIKQQQHLKTKEIKSLRCSLNQIEIKKNTVPNKKLLCMPLELSELNQKETDTSLTCKTSARTASKIAQFRNENKQKLKVTPLSDTTFTKLISSHPIIRPQSKFKPLSNPTSRVKKL